MQRLYHVLSHQKRDNKFQLGLFLAFSNPGQMIPIYYCSVLIPKKLIVSWIFINNI